MFPDDPKKDSMAMTMVQSTTGSQMRSTDVSFLKQLDPKRRSKKWPRFLRCPFATASPEMYHGLSLGRVSFLRCQLAVMKPGGSLVQAQVCPAIRRSMTGTRLARIAAAMAFAYKASTYCLSRETQNVVDSARGLEFSIFCNFHYRSHGGCSCADCGHHRTQSAIFKTPQARQRQRGHSGRGRSCGAR